LTYGYGPGVDSASNRNEYREYFHLTTFMCRLSRNLTASGTLRPVQACNGIA
jgi:hypothetical protein